MADAFDIGAKYGRVGTAVGNVATGFVNQARDESNKAKIDELTMKYNDPNAPEFANLSASQRALKMSRLLYPLDTTMSQRYEQIASTERVREATQKREDEQNAAIAAAFEAPKKTAMDEQKKAYEETKSKFLADQVNWGSSATTLEGLKEELKKAEADLEALNKYKEQSGNPTGETPSWKPPEAWNKPVLPSVNVSEGEEPSYMSRYNRPE